MTWETCLVSYKYLYANKISRWDISDEVIETRNVNYNKVIHKTHKHQVLLEIEENDNSEQ